MGFGAIDESVGDADEVVRWLEVGSDGDELEENLFNVSMAAAKDIPLR